jgi:pimeloyl-ACP methyl ester carboxylesterase
MNVYCLGRGSPTVVLDSGIGGGMADWSKVHKDLSRITRTCAYDRAGYGFSDPGPMPREAAAIATDLSSLLKAANIRGPYVLVGHSAASLNIRLFANWRFDDVTGMVLVDPSGDFQRTRFEAAVPRLSDERLNAGPDRFAACLAVARRALLIKNSDLYRGCRENDPARLETPGSESAALDAASSAQNLITQRKYGALPLIVLTRDQTPSPGFTEAELAAHYAVWSGIHEEFAALSTVGQRRTVAGAGHYIQNDNPKAVIGAVHEVVIAARRGPRRRGSPA